MVKPKTQQKPAEQRSADANTKYKGVRKRKWGKYVSEIRLPNSRERIWLGSYDTAEKAARAFDAAMFCLRGQAAQFNFPQDPPEIAGGRSLTRSEIQVAAARFAHSAPQITAHLDHSSSSSSFSTSSETHPESPSPSVSCELPQSGSETAGLDGSFLDLFATLDAGSNPNPPESFDMFPGFDDFSNEFFVPPLPSVEDYGEEISDVAFSEDSFLWNFQF
ncbi:ethylene-responsive transcription factor ERF017-like [Diospyros lotus]|uniref:ethylene-responsive transcription factor ERF017-like n=1 Tax=Diospyros lotus TaxID=55363 RepID=UPI00225B8DD5|nr:ethylene-responsive transcription factor ERF017-like [Diospyros lotus]